MQSPISQIKAFLGESDYSKYDDKKYVEITKLVANIAWGKGRTVEEVLEKGVGTCTGKHLVLQACYDKLGLKCIPVVCTFRWADQSVNYPPELKQILNQGGWEHGHNFVQLENGIDVDVTWDPALKAYGFKIFPDDWDDSKSFVGVENIIQRWDNAQIGEMKQHLIESLGPEIRERRELFLDKFIAWIDSIHQN